MAAMTELRHLGIATDYPGLHELLRRRRAELGMSFETLNAISGLSYCDKILAPNPLQGPQQPRTASGHAARTSARGIGPEAWGPLLGALGMVLIAAEDPAATARLKARSAYHARAEPQANSKSLSIDTLLAYRERQNLKKRQSAGGKRRLVTLTPELRKKIARKAARIRWRIERAAKRSGHSSMA